MSTVFHVIIPARYGAQRLPGKPLRDLGGRPLIQHVYERSRRSRAATVTVATDDQRIVDAVVAFGGDVCLTATEHPSGTDRIAEACHRLELADDAIVVNVQGDEPQMPGALIDQVADALASNPPATIATACEPIDGREELDDPSVVKVVRDQQSFALYFSRCPIPWRAAAVDHPSAEDILHFRHVGIYAYRAGYVRDFARRAPCELERSERLEQLRALWYGDRIYVCDALESSGIGIDTLEDLERIRRIINR